ncbi:platelet-activating factor receptor [Cololabis saira]|uniref:platelet-activating factor receptor n=1 Tax=Cololabis saira TaxID=129043 RepID=UPI002AD24E54|nr:platelet-activating factor receptor [Cololabis saira]
MGESSTYEASTTKMLGSTDQPLLKDNNSASLDYEFIDSEFRYVLFPVAYSVIFILGFFSNVYVLFVLRCLRGTKGMGEIRIYMTNLTIADLLFACALPFWIGYYTRRGHWVYADFMCRLTGSFFFINTYGTILFLGAISLNRFWAVTRPLDVASSDHRRRGIIVCVVIWACTVAMTIPHLTSEGTHTDSDNFTRCFEGYQQDPDETKKTVAVTHFLIIGMFFVVFFLVVVCNLLIARALIDQNGPQSGFQSRTIVSRNSNRTTLSTRRPQRGVKRRALQMLWAVVGVFVLCFLPHHIVQGPWVLAVLQIKEGWGHIGYSPDARQALNDVHQITLVLMGLNSILDPVVYYFATRKFRGFIMAHIKKFVKGEGCSTTLNSEVNLQRSRSDQGVKPDK